MSGCESLLKTIDSITKRNKLREETPMMVNPKAINAKQSLMLKKFVQLRMASGMSKHVFET